MHIYNVVKKIDYRMYSLVVMLIGLILSCGWYAVCDKSCLSLAGTFNIGTGIIVMAVIFLLALVCAMEELLSANSTKLYYVLLWIVEIGAFVDHFVWMYENRPEMEMVTISFVLVDYICSELFVFVVWFYQEALYPSKHGKTKYIATFLCISLLLNIVYIIVGTRTGFVFYINEYDKYAVGPGYPVLFVFPVIIVILNLYCNVHREMPGRVRVALIIFNLFPILFGSVSAFLSNYCIEYVVLMMTMVFMYGTIQMENSHKRLEQMREISEQRQALTEKQTQITISQIQPHFLYNTLNAIYYLCGKDVKQAKRMILMFSDYLRVNMDSIKSNKPIPFEKELAHTRIYLEIEMIRFGNILNLVYDIKESDFSLPALSLQPLVENAVKHGIRGREDGGTVVISTRRDGTRILITVSDDGVGFDPDHLQEDGRSHVGIENVRTRIEDMCGGSLVIESKINVGTTATIILEEKA